LSWDDSFLPLLPFAITYFTLGLFVAGLACAAWITAGNFQVGGS